MSNARPWADFIVTSVVIVATTAVARGVRAHRSREAASPSVALSAA